MAGNAVVGALRVTLGLDSASFTDGLDGAQKALKDAGAKMQKVGAGLATVGAGMSVAITAPFIALGAHLLQGSQDAAHAAGQVKAALESMGGASGKTAEQLSASAEALRNLTGVDDDEILTKLTANLLSFGNIAGDAFDRAQLAALNLSARMQGDLQGATMMIGKALNDPVKGLAALGRAGIQFTDQQKEQIKSMVAVGNAAGAQGIMLNELERQFGGAAEAAGNADIWKPMKTALMDLEGAFEPIVRDVIGPLIAKVAEMTKAFANLSPETQKFIAIGAAVAAAIGPLLVGLGGVVTAVGALLPVFGAVAAVMSGPVILAIGAAVLAFLAFKDDIIPVVMQFATTLKETLGPKIMPLFDALKGAVSAIGEMFSAIFGSGSGSSSANLKVWGQSIAQVFGAAIDLITGAINVITNVFRALGALLRGDFSAMWGYLWQAVKSAVSAILNAFETLFPGVIDSMRKLVEGVTSWLQGRLFGVLKSVIDKVKGVSDAFFKLYDAVVGHSYVPDMVTEIGQWMAKLDDNMVKPAVSATRTAAEAFEDMQQRVRRSMQGLMSDRESLDLDFRTDSKELNAQLAAGPRKGGIDQKQFDEMQRRLQARYRADSAGLDAAGLSLPDIPALKDIGDTPGVKAINDAVASMNQTITDSREKFADAFEYGIDAALRGDWQGVLQAMFGDVMSDALKGIGRSIFDALGGSQGGGGGGLGSILSGAMKFLPGFARGGSFEVGGSGTVDSKLVAFRATPGERVDISTKGQQRDVGGQSGMIISVDKSRYFDVAVQRAAGPQAMQAASSAVAMSRQDMASAQRHSRQRIR
ncbi:phage tail length tape measure family protein [Brevundimonas bullata]|uniref:phage tail length tape measure family protein n=1 Tax=Brevundimonas bullata TaxID=13160 RepID=UPI000E0C9590|nr:phage tail length tape measure family protein [Brevundimonas bullata]WQE36726.1 phage tail length tape measure family protein [Brevundimonas bullata]